MFHLEPPAATHRYVYPHPGNLLHLDTKKLGRFVRPGHRMTGNWRQTSPGAGSEFVRVAIDDASRVSDRLHPTERTAPTPYREKLSHLWWDCVHVSRRDIFGVADSNYTPKHLLADAATMFAGYVGTNYEPGVGIVLLAVNPGGGGDAYRTRTPEDEVFAPLLAEFKAADHPGVMESFERIMATFPRMVEGWNLQRILRPTLEAAGVTIEEVAFMNVVPYRTRNDRLPPVAAARTAWQRIVDPCLRILAPRAVVAMGKKAGNLVDKLHSGREPVYCVPRTIGDRYVSDEARQVHERMRRELTQRV